MNFVPGEDEDYEASNGLMAPPGSIILFYDSQGPLSFVTLLPRDLPPGYRLMGEVYGKSCQYGIGIPLSPPTSPRGSGASISGVKGNGSFQRALAHIQGRYPGLKGIFDVKVDDQYTSILTVFRRLCTEITAKGFS